MTFRFDGATRCKKGHDLTLEGAIHVRNDNGMKACRKCWLARDRRQRVALALRYQEEGKCPKGHPMTPENTVRSARYGDAHMICRTCQNARALAKALREGRRPPAELPSEEHGEAATTMLIMDLDEQLSRASTSWEKAEIKAKIRAARDAFDAYQKALYARIKGEE